MRGTFQTILLVFAVLALVGSSLGYIRASVGDSAQEETRQARDCWGVDRPLAKGEPFIVTPSGAWVQPSTNVTCQNLPEEFSEQD